MDHCVEIHRNIIHWLKQNWTAKNDASFRPGVLKKCFLRWGEVVMQDGEYLEGREVMRS